MISTPAAGNESYIVYASGASENQGSDKLWFVIHSEERGNAMYTLMSSVSLRKGLISEGPCLLLSMLVAEAFYKFHSFSLEFLAMLATWLEVPAECQFLYAQAVQHRWCDRGAGFH